jgi:hypothetical protein
MVPPPSEMKPNVTTHPLFIGLDHCSAAIRFLTCSDRRMPTGARHPISLVSSKTCTCLREYEWRLTTGLKESERSFRLLNFQTEDSTRVSRILGKSYRTSSAKSGTAGTFTTVNRAGNAYKSNQARPPNPVRQLTHVIGWPARKNTTSIGFREAGQIATLNPASSD